MDRGRDHRTFLRIGLLGAVVMFGGSRMAAQEASPTPAPMPSVAATPVAATPVPTRAPAVPATRRPPQPPVSSPAASPEEPLRKKAMERMIERYQYDFAPDDDSASRRIEQLSPEEREAFKRNLKVWHELSSDERQALRDQADERIRAETEKALQDSGLRLSFDQREVFELRYRQERRRLERELQEKVNVERARQLPQILDRLKHEFADKSTPPATPKPTPSVSVPAASPAPLK